jgi:WD40 repeat protein
VRIWRLSDGINLATTKESGERAGPMAFSPDGALLAVGYPDSERDFRNTNLVRTWRVPQQGGQLSDLVFEVADATRGEGADQTLISLAWSPDGGMIAAGYADQTLHFWRARLGPALYRVETASLPRRIAFAPSPEGGLRLAAGALELWQIPAIEEGGLPRLAAFDNAYIPGLYDMRFLPDGTALALAQYGRIDLRSTMDGSRRYELTGIDGPVNGLAFDPKGEYLVAACQDGTARLYRTRDGRYLDIFGEPSFPILAVDASSNGFWVAVSDTSMRIRFFRLWDGVQMAQVEEPFAAYRLRFAPNSNAIASMTTSGVQLRGIVGNDSTMRLSLQGNVGGVSLSEMAYSPASEFLALVGNGVVQVINPQTRQDVYTLYEGKDNLPWSVAFSPDNAFLAVGWSDGRIRLYWAQDGAPMAEWQAHPSAVRRLAFANNGRLLASLGNEAVIRIWGIEE